MKRFLRKLGRFFWSRGFLKFVLWTATLIVLFYAEEDWRGARAWAATKAKWEARGETFDFDRLTPPVVPDGQNLAAVPLFRLQFDSARGDLAPVDLERAMEARVPASDPVMVPYLWQTGHPPDMAEIKKRLALNYAAAFGRKPGPLDALAQFDALYSIMADLRSAAKVRTFFRLPREYSLNGRNNFTLVTDQVPLARLVSLHAIVALDEGKSDLALDDLGILVKIDAGLREAPMLLGGLCSVAVETYGERIVADGLARHAWSDVELAQMENELARADFLAAYQLDLRGECLLVVATWERYHPPVWPHGWIDIWTSHLADFEFGMGRLVDVEARKVNARAIDPFLQPRPESVAKRFMTLDFLLPQAGSILGHTAEHLAEAQVGVDEARIACALERYRLAHGAYPRSLEGLAPAFIDAVPHDVLNGRAYRYRVNADGTYVLYSVGWDQTDDGGKVAYEKDNPSQKDWEQGDWVWVLAR